MTTSKIISLTILMLVLMSPTGFAHADSAIIDDFSIQSEIVQGENVTVTITVSYDFTSDAELKPGVFS